ncbi:MAG: non-canonical purine NTP pyrophosphatase, RdgB/HAM1 family [Ardenticatenia bacterium]|jgi:XTP/dITP diphosphohydrolase|nr:MAG: non-canonical purine NTP pyrophosphatase, RdgB/HAM1 family [Ardenticatenia bacterium]
MDTKPLLIATNNPGKLREFRELFHDRWPDCPLELVSLSEVHITFEPEESGHTFVENAVLKARFFAIRSGLPTLADDSGLEIDALGGAPGVHSARYGNTARGEDTQRIALVLEQLQNVPWPQRTARFRCVIAIALPDGRYETANGSVEGYIDWQPRGEHGFGYDPIFYIPEFGCTMAQLEPAVKNRISHRARALQAALPLIQRLVLEQG